MSDYHFFYGHTGPVEKACFSQWYMRPFEINGLTYCCMEQYMMASKALLFNDLDVYRQIMDSTDPAKMKALGRKVKNFDSAVWDKNKYEIVYRGNMAKFSQNWDLKMILLSTGNKILVEASPYDTIWGIGLSANDPRAQSVDTWCGTNLLGRILTDLRNDIKNL